MIAFDEAVTKSSHVAVIGCGMNILILCTGNSARTILREVVLNRYGADRVTAWFTGSRPDGRVDPEALTLLVRRGIATRDHRSKSKDRFAGPGAPVKDVVITVCGNAASEIRPIWPGVPRRAHWSVEDPAPAAEEGWPHAFARVYEVLASRARALL